MRSVLRLFVLTFTVVALSLTALVGPSTASEEVEAEPQGPAAVAESGTVSENDTNDELVDAGRAPYPGCKGFDWRWTDASTLKITAESAWIRAHFPKRQVYGLLHIVTRTSKKRLLYRGEHNVSRHAPFRADVYASQHGSVVITLTNDANTTTYCSSTLRFD